MRMKNRCGPPVSGDDFFGRNAEIAQTWDLIERNHVLLTAPRRVGKTSLFYHLKDHPQEGWDVLYVDIQACRSYADVLDVFAQEVTKLNSQSRLMKGLGTFLQRVKKISLAKIVEMEWDKNPELGAHKISEQILTALKSPQAQLLVIIDEFPIFVQRLGNESLSKQEDFLNGFRYLRQAVERQSQGTIRFLLGGSIGLAEVVNQTKLSGTINDLHTLHLEPFDPETATHFLDLLGESEKLTWNPEMLSLAIEHLGDYLIPFYLQLLFAQVKDLHKLKRQPLNLQIVHQAYENLLKPESNKHFEPWDERLDKMFSAQELELLRSILKAACQESNGIGRAIIEQEIRSQMPDRAYNEALFNRLLHILQHDGYLYLTPEKKYRFNSPLLRDWWKRKYID